MRPLLEAILAPVPTSSLTRKYLTKTFEESLRSALTTCHLVLTEIPSFLRPLRLTTDLARVLISLFISHIRLCTLELQISSRDNRVFQVEVELIFSQQLLGQTGDNPVLAEPSPSLRSATS